MSRTPLETVQSWKEIIERHLYDLESMVEELETTGLEDLMDQVSEIKGQAAEAIASLPCDNGIIEFVDHLTEDYHHADDVALTSWDKDDPYVLDLHDLASYSMVATHLKSLNDWLDDDGDLRLALTDLIGDLENSDIDWGELPETRVEYGKRTSLLRELVRDCGITKSDAEVLEARVHKGADFLDRHFPEWVGHVNVSRLQLSSGTMCVLGQLSQDKVIPKPDNDIYPEYGYWPAHQWLDQTGWTDVRNAGTNWAYSMGFNVAATSDVFSEGVSTLDLFDALNRLWTHQIEARQKAAEANDPINWVKVSG